MANSTFDRIKRCVIITGMSGSGKSTALNILEDQGFYVIDNLPPTLLPQLLDVLREHRSALTQGIAAVVDVRGGDLLDDLIAVIGSLKKKAEEVKIVYLNASDAVLVRRFEMTRRRHPLGEGIPILESVEAERRKTSLIRQIADVDIDTSDLNSEGLRSQLLSSLGLSSGVPSLIFMSFGFKYGIPQDSDFLFDVRFLPNPNYIDFLHSLSGQDESVQKYLGQFEETRAFCQKAFQLLDFVLPLFRNTGKGQIQIAIGCTGGRHRSVTIAELFARHFALTWEKVLIRHRDLDREQGR